MAGIRAFTPQDVPEVADLVWRVLHEQQGPSPDTLKGYLTQLFLQNPWVEENVSSLVYADSSNKVQGFFGVVPRRVSLQGKSILMAFGSNFVFNPQSRASMGAMQLVRAFMKGPQDVSITDSANESARQLLRSLGFTVLPVYSMIWARPLRPAAYALHGAVRFKKNGTLHAAAAVATPFCRIADYFATNLKISPFHQAPPGIKAEELDVDSLLSCLATIPNKQWLLPSYQHQSLEWVLRFVARRNAFGSLRKLLLRDQAGKIIGWYIYGLATGAVGEVLQIGADSSSIGIVLDHLFRDAWEQGLMGVHGRVEPYFMEDLTRRAAFFLRNGSWTLAHTNMPEVLSTLHTGNAFLSRLDGEWSLRFGDSRN